MNFLLEFWPYIAAAGAAVVAIVSAFLKGQSAGKNRQLAKEAEARAKNLQDVRRAQDAAAAVRHDPAGELSDPNNRDIRR